MIVGNYTRHILLCIRKNISQDMILLFMERANWISERYRSYKKNTVKVSFLLLKMVQYFIFVEKKAEKVIKTTQI
jgi:hypothetical protein